MKNWIAELRTSLLAVLALAVILCGLYPLTVWVLAQGLFPGQGQRLSDHAERGDRGIQS